MLFNLECLIISLKLYADIYIECRGLVCCAAVVGILYIATCPRLVALNIDILLDKLGIQILKAEETT